MDRTSTWLLKTRNLRANGPVESHLEEALPFTQHDGAGNATAPRLE